MLNTPPLSIDIISDVVCPWCYVGKRRLEAALAQRAVDAAQPVEVRWHAFELNPDIPASGVDRRSYLEQKFGGPERAKQIYARIKAAGDEVGISFEFDRIVRQPNTINAHRLIAWAQDTDLEISDALIERLFRAYFVEGIDIGDIDALARLAGDAGFDATAARSWLASDAGRAAIRAEEQRAHALGVTGVPFFVFNQRLAVSGAQSSEVLLGAMKQAWLEELESGAA
ncbi:MAG TPA: DsbA family oxidoreductase [Burkholderiaceae bacterium]|nr:DsbA family oxidoreductase [Burkholderiaceae bacterium]